MRYTKLLSYVLVAAIVIWILEAVCLIFHNAAIDSRIRAEETQENRRMELEYKQRMSDLDQEFTLKKHLATGKTVYDRIFNANNQTVSELIKRITQEALPEGWSCDVKVEEFTHFILLISLPRNAHPQDFLQFTSALKPILDYCDWAITDVAMFDEKHKCLLFLDQPLLSQIKSGSVISGNEIQRARNQGSSFTRFNSIAIACEKIESHLWIPFELIGLKGVIQDRALLDTGASVTMISLRNARMTENDDLQSATRQTFSTANGAISCPIVRREINIGGFRKTIDIAVNQQDEFNLIGMNYFDGMYYIVDSENSSVYMWKK